MSDFDKTEFNKELKLNESAKGQFSESGLYIKEDDQDWGSAGMNDIQNQSDVSQ